MSCEILKREEKCASFAVVSQTARVMAETPQKLVRMESHWSMIQLMTMYFTQKKIIQNFRNGSPEMSGTEAPNALMGESHRLEISLEWKMEISGKSISANEEAATTFLAVLKLIKENNFIQSQSLIMIKLDFSRRCPIDPLSLSCKRGTRELKLEGQTDSRCDSISEHSKTRHKM